MTKENNIDTTKLKILGAVILSALFLFACIMYIALTLILIKFTINDKVFEYLMDFIVPSGGAFLSMLGINSIVNFKRK